MRDKNGFEKRYELAEQVFGGFAFVFVCLFFGFFFLFFWVFLVFLSFYLFIYFFGFLGSHAAAPVAYGGSKARGPTGATDASLHHSHSNMGSELCL